jgi:hypothetical protein
MSDLDLNDPTWWQQQEGEAHEAWLARTKERSDRETMWSNYEQYGDIVEEVLEGYRTADGEKLNKAEVIETVADWVYTEGQQAAEDREDELKSSPSETAELIAQTEDWKEYEPDDDDEEEGE